MINNDKINKLTEKKKRENMSVNIKTSDFDEELEIDNNDDNIKEILEEEKSKKELVEKLREDEYEKSEDEEIKSSDKKINSKIKDEVIINFENVELKIRQDKILRDIKLKIKKGEFVYIVGSSGAGKSSLIKLLYRERKVTSGVLNVLDFKLRRIPQRKIPRLRKKIGVIFQDYKLLSDKTIYENVKFTLDVTGEKNKKEKVESVLKQVGIFEHRNKFPDELSGGQQQRAAIARAIVDKPDILVCDEPTGNLDPENAIATMELLKEINEKNGTTILMATHDVGIVNKYQSRVILMENGKIVGESNGKYIYK